MQAEVCTTKVIKAEGNFITCISGGLWTDRKLTEKSVRSYMEYGKDILHAYYGYFRTYPAKNWKKCQT